MLRFLRVSRVRPGRIPADPAEIISAVVQIYAEAALILHQRFRLLYVVLIERGAMIKAGSCRQPLVCPLGKRGSYERSR
jgi:hypothetical protein